MTFSTQWEDAYRNGYNVAGGYPHFQKLLVSNVVEANRVLELGPGLGANIPFVQAVGWAPYYAVEGSAAAAEKLRLQYPDLAPRIACADFTKEIPFERGFDLVLERASIAHNDLESIRRCIDLIYDALNPGGLFVSADWFSTSHSEACRGEGVDAATRTGYPDGQFYGVGRVHFSSEAELRELFDRFEGISLEERRTIRKNALRNRAPRRHYISEYFAEVEYTTATWEIVVRKPK